MFDAFCLVHTLIKASWLSQYARTKGVSTWKEAWFWCIYVFLMGARRQSRKMLLTSSHINTHVTEGTCRECVRMIPLLQEGSRPLPGSAGLFGCKPPQTNPDPPADVMREVVGSSRTMSRLSHLCSPCHVWPAWTGRQSGVQCFMYWLVSLLHHISPTLYG